MANLLRPFLLRRFYFMVFDIVTELLLSVNNLRNALPIYVHYTKVRFPRSNRAIAEHKWKSRVSCVLCCFIFDILTTRLAFISTTRAISPQNKNPDIGVFVLQACFIITTQAWARFWVPAYGSADCRHRSWSSYSYTKNRLANHRNQKRYRNFSTKDCRVYKATS